MRQVLFILMMGVLPSVYSQTDKPKPSAPPQEEEKDDSAFHYHMGLNCYDGLGDPPDYIKAVVHFKRAAQLNHPQAQGMLGQCYRNGRGVNRDPAKAFYWIERASKQNDPIALFLYGTLLATGQGTPLDYKKALTYYLKAAAKGHAAAMNNIGALHEQGNGVPRNYVEALKWYKMAAAMNLANAQCNLGQLYASGRGTVVNMTEAVKWYQKAANQNHPQAQFLLGAAYYFGKGVKRNLVKSHQWMNLSANLGNPSARRHRAAIADKLTPQQAQQANLGIVAFQAKHSSSSPASSQATLTTGTGFFITSQGHLLTSNHLIANGRRIEVRMRTGNYAAELIKADADNNIALLRIKARTTPLILNAQATPRVGQNIFTIGFPNLRARGIASKYTEGRIKNLYGVKDDPHLLQISVPVKSNTSGGALIDEKGTAIGMVTFRLDDLKTYSLTGSLPQNANYALKSTQILDFLATVPLVQALLPHPPPTIKAVVFEAAIENAQKAAALILIHD
jgi:TPR repeat protein